MKSVRRSPTLPLLSFLALSLALLAGEARAGLAVNALGGVNFGGTARSEVPTVSFRDGKGFIYGASVELGFFPFLGLDIGLLSVRRKEITIAGVSESTNDYRALEVPVLVRFTPLPIFDFGAGVFYASIPSSAGATFARNDFGVRVSARAKFPLAPLFHLIVDANYNFGLKDLDTSSNSLKTRAKSVLTGVSFGF